MVAESRIARLSSDYEPDELLLLYSAKNIPNSVWFSVSQGESRRPRIVYLEGSAGVQPVAYTELFWTPYLSVSSWPSRRGRGKHSDCRVKQPRCQLYSCRECNYGRFAIIKAVIRSSSRDTYPYKSEVFRRVPSILLLVFPSPDGFSLLPAVSQSLSVPASIAHKFLDPMIPYIKT